jgi:hypothetical protein
MPGAAAAVVCWRRGAGAAACSAASGTAAAPRCSVSVGAPAGGALPGPAAAAAAAAAASGALAICGSGAGPCSAPRGLCAAVWAGSREAAGMTAIDCLHSSWEFRAGLQGAPAGAAAGRQLGRW